MPKPQLLEQFGESAIGTYKMTDPSDEVSALKLKLADFDSQQRTNKFSLYQEGIEQQIYNGQMDEVAGRNILIQEAQRIGLDELDIAKLKTAAAQAAYDKRKAGAAKKLTDEQVKMMLEQDVDDILSGRKVEIPPAQGIGPSMLLTINNMVNYFYKLYGSYLSRGTIDSIIKQRKGGAEEGILSQIGL